MDAQLKLEAITDNHSTMSSHPGSNLPISLPSKYLDLPFFALSWAVSKLAYLAVVYNICAISLDDFLS